MRTNILIRVDGNARMGLGHILRCYSLAHLLKNYYSICFFPREIPDLLCADIIDNGFGCFKVENEAEFLNQINKNDIVVLDGYQFDTGYQKEIKSIGAKLVVIDDLHNQAFFADLIINHAPGISQDNYKAQSYTKFALGLDYMLLRPSFIEEIKKLREVKKLETVLICFGGSDPNGLAEKSLEVILKYPQFNKILIVTRLLFECTKRFTILLRNDNRIIHHNNLNEKKLLEVMLEADLAVAPSSTILLELFTVGVPAITGYYVENQKEAATVFLERGLALSVGDMNINYRDKLAKQIDKIFKIDYNEMTTRQKKMMNHAKSNMIKIFKEI